jgi:serine/threonine protein kinase
MVLKRTRYQLHDSFAKASNEFARFASIMAELQILMKPSVREHENIIDFLGVTRDFEPNTDDLESVWPILALEAAQCTMETLLYESRDGPVASRLKYCHDIAKALDFLHDYGVAHCDIKSENVLICMSSLPGMVAKLMISAVQYWIYLQKHTSRMELLARLPGTPLNGTRNRPA